MNWTQPVEVVMMDVLELSLAYSGYIRCLPLDQQLQVAIDNSDLS